jgi:hypothetical protein
MLTLRATVARVYRVPGELVVVAGGGVGLRLTDASPVYFDFLNTMAPSIWKEELSIALRKMGLSPSADAEVDARSSEQM